MSTVAVNQLKKAVPIKHTTLHHAPGAAGRRGIRKESMYTFISTGNHFYPHTRYSVGMNFQTFLANRSKMGWYFNKPNQCYHAISENLHLIRPATYSPDFNGLAIQNYFEDYHYKHKDAIYVIPSVEHPLGVVINTLATPTRAHPSLLTLDYYMKVKEVRALLIGIKYPMYTFYDERYLMDTEWTRQQAAKAYLWNRFPPHEQTALDNVVFPGIMDMDLDKDDYMEFDYHEMMEYVGLVEEEEEKMRKEKIRNVEQLKHELPF